MRVTSVQQKFSEFELKYTLLVHDSILSFTIFVVYERGTSTKVGLGRRGGLHQSGSRECTVSTTYSCSQSPTLAMSSTYRSPHPQPLSFYFPPKSRICFGRIFGRKNGIVKNRIMFAVRVGQLSQGSKHTQPQRFLAS